MLKYILLLPLALLVYGCCNPAAAVPHTARVEKEETLELDSDKCTLENEFLYLTLFPGISGGIENISIKNQNLPLLWGGKLLQISSGPLIVRPSASGVLFMEKFWRGSDGEIISNMEIRNHTGNSVTLYCPEYGSSNAAMFRSVTLEKNALAVNFDVQVKFNKPPRKGYFSPWLNLMPAGEIEWIAAIPAVGGDAINGLGMKTDFPATGIYRGGWHGPNTYFTPERNWIAVSAPRKNVALALVHNYDKSKSTFYSWKGRLDNKIGRTIEIIMPELELNKELRGQYSYRLLIFPGISDLKEIIGDTAVEYRQQGKNLILRFCSVSKQPAQNVELCLTEKNKAPVVLGNYTLPPLNPGKVAELSFELPTEKFDGIISGKLGEQKFSILPVIR